MTAFQEYVSGNLFRGVMAENILICGLNWLGDCVMSMPAIQVLRKQRPDAHIVILVKSKLKLLWEMQDAVDQIVTLDSDGGGILRAVKELKSLNISTAYVFPQSFRSGLIPTLAKIPQRRGQIGHFRSWMLNSIVKNVVGDSNRHQAWEYVDILDLNVGDEGLPLPVLNVPAVTNEGLVKKLAQGQGKTTVGMFPGAARGAAKCWPPEYFIEVGNKLVANEKCRIIIFGADAEKEMCSNVAQAIGPDALDFSGSTTLKDLAGLLGVCTAVICNDSGGMHLAASVGVGVVAIYGMTDPVKTGPWGEKHRIISRGDVAKSRDIDRNSPEAIACLRSIKPETVYAAAKSLIEETL